jgi:hypothetical protein
MKHQIAHKNKICDYDISTQMRPSFIGAGLNGLIMLIVFVYAFMYWSKMNNYEQIIIISLIGIQLGIHALLHHMEEIYYDYNPLENKWNHIKTQ